MRGLSVHNTHACASSSMMSCEEPEPNQRRRARQRRKSPTRLTDFDSGHLSLYTIPGCACVDAWQQRRACCLPSAIGWICDSSPGSPSGLVYARPRPPPLSCKFGRIFRPPHRRFLRDFEALCPTNQSITSPSIHTQSPNTTTAGAWGGGCCVPEGQGATGGAWLGSWEAASSDRLGPPAQAQLPLAGVCEQQGE